MVARCGFLVVALLAVLVSPRDAVLGQPLPVPGRPNVFDIGQPRLITRAVLSIEMRRNDELRGFVAQYGWPDYAEIQEVAPSWPYADYEVRLYYLKRDLAMAYGRVFLSPRFPNYGVRKATDKISPETLQRLLTAREHAGAAARTNPPVEYFPPRPVEPSSDDLNADQPALEPPLEPEEEPAAEMQIEARTEPASDEAIAARQDAPASE